MILDRIFENRRRQVEQLRRKRPLKQMREAALAFAREHPARDFAAALRAPGRAGRLAVIAEVKKASPSKGLICAEFDPAAAARRYEAAGAAAVSVLTEETFFQGGAHCLAAARAAVNLPLLRKDFLFCEWQLCEARLLGADAVLLIAAMLPEKELARLRVCASRLGLAALVEVHDEAELAAAKAAGAEIFGINNRNLRDFSVDLGTAGRLAPLLPKGALFVAESGVRTPADARRLRTAGADAVLVGETLMRAGENAPAVLRALAGA